MRLLTVALALVVVVCMTWLVDAVADDGQPKELLFKGYPDAPTFTIAPTKRKARRRRCSRCHAEMDPNPTIRELKDAPHVDGISHGKGRLWCLVCHDENQRDNLRTLLGEKVAFTQAYIVCGACHADRQRDWYFGGHGKRLQNWRGERVIYDCTHCHDPHEPAIEPRQPKPPPPVRAGLQRMKGREPIPDPAWQRRLTEHKQSADD